MSAESSCSADSVQMISTPSGISTNDPASGSYSGVSLSSSATTAYPFTITAGAAGTYDVQLSADGITSTESSIVFVAPSTLTVSGTPSTSTIASSGGTFTLSITITNPTSSAISTSYSLSGSSGLSFSGDQTSATVSVGALSTRNYQWTVTVSSNSASSAATRTATFSIGSNTNAFSSTVTVQAATTTTTSSSSSGGGGGGGIGGVSVSSATLKIEEGKATATAGSVAAGGQLNIDLNKTVDIGVTRIEIGMKNLVKNIKIVFERTITPPAPTKGKVYKYFSVTRENFTETDVNNITMKFAVAQSWLTENNVDAGSVWLYRYTTQWDKLSTLKLGESSVDVTYQSTLPGLSYFAIASEPAPSGGEETTKEVVSPLGKIMPGGDLFVPIVLLILIIGGVYYFTKRSKKSKKQL